MITRSDMTSIKSAVALAVMAAMGTVAHAEQIAYGGIATGEAVNIEWDGWGGVDQTTAGLMTLNGSAGTALYEAFCVELAQYTSTSLKTYTSSTFTGTAGTNLTKLFSSSFGSVDTAREYAAFQVAIWEITHEFESTSFSVSPPGRGQDFNIAGGRHDGAKTSEDAAVRDLANGYLLAASSYSGVATYSLTKLSHSSHQDFVTWEYTGGDNPSVPEPSTVSLMLAGLGIAGIAARRRRQD